MQTSHLASYKSGSSLSIAAKNYTEDELVEALYLKDRLAFAYLYHRYASNLNVIIYQVLKNKALSEDVLQEAFFKIWKNFSSYDKEKGKIYTWMASLTRNLAIDVWRSNLYKTQNTISTEGLITVMDQPCEFKKFDSLHIDKYVLNLEPNFLQLIMMAYFKGMTQNEISKHTGIPLGTVKTKLRNAILHLRKQIN